MKKNLTFIILILCSIFYFYSKGPNYKILIVGPHADNYAESLKQLNSSKYLFDFFNTTNVINDFYRDRKTPLDHNTFTEKAQSFDEIIFILDKDDFLTRPELVFESVLLVKQHNILYEENQKTFTLVLPNEIKKDNFLIINSYAYKITKANNINYVSAGKFYFDFCNRFNVPIKESNKPSSLEKNLTALSIFSNKKINYKELDLSDFYMSQPQFEFIEKHYHSNPDNSIKDDIKDNQYLAHFFDSKKFLKYISYGDIREKSIIKYLDNFLANKDIISDSKHIDEYFDLELYGEDKLEELTILDSSQMKFLSNVDFVISSLDRIHNSEKWHNDHWLDTLTNDTLILLYHKLNGSDFKNEISKSMIKSGRIKSLDFIHYLPNLAAFGRAWLERPDLKLISDNNKSLTTWGNLLYASMIYTIIFSENPVNLLDNETDENKKYILDLGYKTIIQLNLLENPDTYQKRITIGEIGKIAFSDETSNHWTKQSFKSRYKNPTVYISGVSKNTGEKLNTKIRNVNSTGFEWKLTNSTILHENITIGKLSYLAVEKGHYSIDQKTMIQSGTNKISNNWTEINSSNTMDTPLILTQLYDPSTTILSNKIHSDLTDTSYKLKLHDEFGIGNLEDNVEVNWLIFDSDNKQLSKFFSNVELEKENLNPLTSKDHYFELTFNQKNVNHEGLNEEFDQKNFISLKTGFITLPNKTKVKY